VTAVSLDALVASGVVRSDAPLAPLTTYRFGGPAAYLADVASEGELRRILDAAAPHRLPLFVLGRGSNVVVSDAGFDGLVIRLVGDFLDITVTPEGDVVAGGGAPLPRVARTAVAHDRGGLEFYVGIPGTVGGAIRMNAGGHGTDTAACLVNASVLETARGRITTATPATLELRYRHSRLRDGDVVLTARFRTVPQPAGEGERRMREITRWRKEHQPGGTFNAGSVFKNPPGDAAGRLIDSLGLKGFRCGAVTVSPRHANFFEAGDGATAQDVYDLVAAIRSRVADATGIWLEPEIAFLGEFRSAPS
jgi:UDP-N-acetylmuramate dehydrogenase